MRSSRTKQRRIDRADVTRRHAFTLVELLVAMFIIAILIAMVVGVTKYVYDEASRKQTQTTQNLLMVAIAAYYDLTGENPHDQDDVTPGTVDPDKFLLQTLRGDPNTVSLTDPDDANRFIARIQKAVRPTLMDLSADALDLDNDVIRDGFGNAMRYERDGGLGGSPVVISAGPDGIFGNEDDIRSGEH